MALTLIGRIRSSLRFHKDESHTAWPRPRPYPRQTLVSRIRESLRFRKDFTHLAWTRPADPRSSVTV